MEDILHLYEQPYDPLHPVICFDERPCQMLGDTVNPLPSEPGKPVREDYHYERKGTCVMLTAFEPLTGQRFVDITETRTASDYAVFMHKLADIYPDAEKIRIVQDNLNTHKYGSFYTAFSPEKSFDLCRRFEFHHTPVKASWLNMAEIEISAIATECLHRRIPDIHTLNREVQSCVRERNRFKAKVRWRFTKNDARKKMKRHYPIIQN